MKELKQNTLAEATTESSFLTTINENAGETVVSLQREVELETGETVIVEGVTPDKMKAILNNGVSPEVVTFKTPGEPVGELDGVCQAYNKSLEEVEDSIVEKDNVLMTVNLAPSIYYKFNAAESNIVAAFAFMDNDNMGNTTVYHLEGKKAISFTKQDLENSPDGYSFDIYESSIPEGFKPYVKEIGEEDNYQLLLALADETWDDSDDPYVYVNIPSGIIAGSEVNFSEDIM